MPEPELSVLVVSFNTRELTLECLRSIYRETKAIPFEVVVVDNASSDGSADAIAAEFDRVKLIPLEENIGFGRANNLAAERATGKYLLLLNPDTVVLDQALEKLLDFAVSRGGDGIYGGRTVFPDGSLNRYSCWGRLTPWSLFCGTVGLTALFRHTMMFDSESYGSWQRDSVREVDIVTGCFLLISRRLWDRLGGFDPSFFMYYEEADLCRRAWQLGVQCILNPSAVIIHYGSASERIRADKMVRLFRAEAQFIEKHWGPFSARYGIAMLKLWTISRLVAYCLLSALRSDSRDASANWREIWARRKEWDLRELRA
jgi:hypothetical protein